MAFSVSIALFLLAFVASGCFAGRLSNVQTTEVETEEGTVRDVKEADANCNVVTERTSFNQTNGLAVSDANSHLTMVKYAEGDGTCYFTYANDEKSRCGSLVPSSENPSEEKEVVYKTVADLNLASLPASLTNGFNCQQAKLQVPVTTSDVTSHRQRRATGSTACSYYILYYYRCTLIPGTCDATGKCLWYCVYYTVPVEYCP